MMDHQSVLKMQFAEATRAAPTKFETRLFNWIRWLTGDIHSHGRCLSVESRFQSPGVFEAREVSIPIDSRDAELFDKAYRALLEISQTAAYVVKAWYIKCTAAGKIARILQCRLSDVSNKLHASLKLLEKCLHTLDKSVYSVPHKF